MSPADTRSDQSTQSTLSRLKPSVAFVVMIFGALIAFEIFNYSTTEHALGDLLGNLTFAGIPWSTVLALAFCGIDFAGIARLFTPEQGMDEPKEVWYLFGAWLMAATMNAILTWWGVSMAVANHSVQSSAVVDPKTISSVVPVFVAIMVWVIRILIIGTLSLAMDRLMHPGMEQRVPIQNAISAAAARQPTMHTTVPATQPMSIPTSLNSAALGARPQVNRGVAASGRYSRPTGADEPEYVTEANPHSRQEPTYHSLSMSARPAVNSSSKGSASGENSGANRLRRS